MLNKSKYLLRGDKNCSGYVSRTKEKTEIAQLSGAVRWVRGEVTGQILPIVRDGRAFEWNTSLRRKNLRLVEKTGPHSRALLAGLPEPRKIGRRCKDRLGPPLAVE